MPVRSSGHGASVPTNTMLRSHGIEVVTIAGSGSAGAAARTA